VTPAVGPEQAASLFEHALSCTGNVRTGRFRGTEKPFPDAAADDRESPQAPGQRREGVAVAEILDRHFARPDAEPSELVYAFHDVYVPAVSRNPHVDAAALRADRERVRAAGRWLVRHSGDRCSVSVGLALLATDPVVESDDIVLLRTIGLRSDFFAALAIECLAVRARRDVVRWLAERTTGWGRVHAILALGQANGGGARSWLLRNACNADILDGYYAAAVAQSADLRAAIAEPDADDALVDHTGWLLFIMAECDGMGGTLAGYPSAPAVLTAHAGHRSRQAPTAERHGKTRLLVGPLGAPDRSHRHVVRRGLCEPDRLGGQLLPGELLGDSDLARAGDGLRWRLLARPGDGDDRRSAAAVGWARARKLLKASPTRANLDHNTVLTLPDGADAGQASRCFPEPAHRKPPRAGCPRCRIRLPALVCRRAQTPWLTELQ
jgi:hypothetical protein